MIKFKKQNILHNLVESNKQDTRKLYKIVNNIMGKKSLNPLPEAKSDEILAEDFANFFLNQNETIRDKFHNIPPYEPTETHISQLSKFSTLSEEVKKTIMGMQSKTCKLDQIPTNKLKQVLQSFLPSLTKIVNLSLNSGTFNENWKTAIVRPLIKATKKGTIKTYYQPISNLPFISKTVENVLSTIYTLL